MKLEKFILAVECVWFSLVMMTFIFAALRSVVLHHVLFFNCVSTFNHILSYHIISYHTLSPFSFARAELDLADADDQKYPPTFSVSMDVVLGAETQGIQKYTEPWDQLSIAKLVPNSCFRSKEDYWACREEFGTILCIF